MTKRLHDEIYAELPEDFIRRMRNWVRGKDGAAVGTSRFTPAVDNSGYREAIMPTMFGEAQDTDAAIRKLPQRYQEVVATFWLYESRDLRWMSEATRKLRLWKLGPASFREWLETGHERLQVIIAKQKGAQGRRAAISAAKVRE